MFKKMLCVLALLMAGSVFAAVDVNKADQAGLESVKGIGTKMSVRILDERKKSSFKDWSDLMSRVKGVKASAATRLSKEGLTVNGAAFEGGADTSVAKSVVHGPAKKDKLKN